MGTIMYGNLVELLLEEGDKTEEEIINEAKGRFGFPDKGLSCEIKLQLSIGKKYDYIWETKGVYKLLKLNNCPIFGRTAFLELLKNAPQDYFIEKPHINKVKQALEERMK